MASDDIESGIEVDEQERLLPPQVDPPDPAASTTWVRSWGDRILSFGAAAVAIIVLPFCMSVVSIFTLELPKKLMIGTLDDGNDPEVKGGSEGYDEIAGMYNKARRYKILQDRIMIRFFSLVGRTSALTLTWLYLSLIKGRLRDVQILGSPMWKWSLLALVFTTGFFLGLTFLYLLIVVSFRSRMVETFQYYLVTMENSIPITAYFGVVMVTWLVYFRTSHGLNQPTTPNHWVFDYVTWTLVSLFVGSLLWMFKAFLMAKWRADAIYRRLEPRMFIASLKFFFIGICAAGFRDLRLIEYLLVEKVAEAAEAAKAAEATEAEADRNRNANSKKYHSKLLIMSEKMGLRNLYLVNHVLTSLVDIMSQLIDPEDEEEEIVDWLNQNFNDTTTPKDKDECTPESLQKLIHSHCHDPKGDPKGDGENGKNDDGKNGDGENGKNDDGKHREKDEIFANVLFELVREEIPLDSLTFHDFTKWMVDAHKDCTNMGRTLADANAMVNYLDMFLSCIIFFIVALLWLLVTGVSSTKVLITVATPILALSFMFGDTTKTFFQGIIFCFCTHPFYVGDHCILDGTELEVKNMSILTTTFMKIGSKEKKLYPNTVLAKKAIVNLGWQPDPRDSLVLTLDSSTNIKILETKIKKFMTRKKSLFKEDSWELIVKEVGDNCSVEIQFTHVLTIHDLSHNQCFKKKRKQKSDFLKKLKKYIKESQIEQVYPPKCDAPTTANEIEESNT